MTFLVIMTALSAGFVCVLVITSLGITTVKAVVRKPVRRYDSDGAELL